MGFFRLFLALSIAFQHSGKNWGLSGGRAVEVFFIISGFYMALILTTGKYKEYKTFLINRLLRIYPLYLVVAASTLVLSLLIHISPFPQYLEYSKDFDLLTWGYLCVSNLTLIGQDASLFMGIQEGHLQGVVDFTKTAPLVTGFLFIPQAWSLSVELMFYCIAPAFLWLEKKAKLIILTLFIILSMGCRICLILGDFPYDPWAYRFFPSVLYLFLLGSLFYHFYENYFFSRLEKIKKRHITYGLALTSLLGILYWMSGLSKIGFNFKNIMGNLQKLLAVQGYEPLVNEIINTTVPYIIAACFICVLFYATSKNRIDRLVGELSYPMYVVHFLVINILSGTIVRNSYFSYLAVGISILLSIGLVKWVQDPIEHYRRKRLKAKSTTFEKPNVGEFQNQYGHIA